MKTKITLAVAVLSLGLTGFSKAPPKTEGPASAPIPLSKPYRLLKDKTKTCVFAPTAATELEKRAVLIAGANEFGKTAKGDGPFELCLALIPNESNGREINTYTLPGKPDQSIDPGGIKWSASSNAPEVTLHPGYEREDAATYIAAMVASLNGKACKGKKGSKTCKPDYKKALEIIHAEVGVKEHPLDWLLAP